MKKMKKISRIIISIISIVAVWSIWNQAAGPQGKLQGLRMAESIGAVDNVLAAESEAGTQEQKTVRVAFPTQEGMSSVGANGDLMGYNYQYLQNLAEYAGWNLEYITFDGMKADESIMAAMQMVMSGEADLLGPMLKSASVEKMFDFTQDNYGVVYTTLCALEKSTTTSLNYSKYDPLRVAVYKSAETRNQEVSEYLDQLEINYELIECDTTEEQIQMLNEGKADVLSSITLSYFEGTRSVAEFAPRPYYFVTTKGNTELLAEMDEATAKLNYTRPYLQEQLQQEFFGDTSAGFILTEEETRYINTLGTLNVLCVDDNAPYVSREKDGDARGMLVSLLNDFAGQQEIKVSYTFVKDLASVEEEWKTGKYDCIAGMPFSSGYCAQNGVIRSEAVTAVNLVLISKQNMKNAVQDSTVAIYKPLADQINLDRYGSVLLCDSQEECYTAVEKGEAEYACTDRLNAEYELFERGSNLVTAPIVGDQEKITIAISKEMDTKFISILNKYIHALSDSTKTTYLSEASSHSISNGIVYYVKTNPVQASLFMAVIAVLIVSIIMIALNAKRNKQRNVELLKANSAKTDFLARMSHDIRTPMNAIIGYLSLAKEADNSEDKIRHCIDNSEVAAKHMLQLINDILDMSSIESGKLKIASEEFCIADEVADITKIFHQTAQNKGVNFKTYVHGMTDEWVIGDDLRVNQILMNLISNAVKFTDKEGQVTLDVTQVKTETGGSDENSEGTLENVVDYVTFEFKVSDTGIGMSEEYMSRLFQPFEQESANTAKKYGGSGLGLSIANNLIKMMGGELRVESTQNVGTTFTAVIRFKKSSHQQNMQISNAKSIRAVIVNDDKPEAEELKALLKLIGVKAMVAENSQDALKRIRSRVGGDYPFNLCVIDEWAGGETGVTIAEKIKEAFSQEDLKVTMTAYDITAVEDEAKAAGVLKVTEKPVFISSMHEDLKELFDGAGAEQNKSDLKQDLDLTNIHLLLAEDNPMNMEIAVTMLEKAGVKVDQAHDGKEASDMFLASEPGTYNLILMDVQMPVMDGYEATKVIRESGHAEAESIPIIAMTANAFAEDVREALDHKMDAHVAKPINYDKLFGLLKRFV